MKMRLVSVGTRLPGWINEGVETYVRRLPADNSLRLDEIPVGRGRSAAERLREEGRRLLAKVDPADHVVVLDEAGKAHTSRELADELERWRHLGVDVVLIIGGPDGVADAVRSRANASWSLSSHTLPHGLARVMVAEQIYRAWTLLTGHPYHRD